MAEPEGEVLAAGAVPWRHAAPGVEVALIHRPRYDDWSFPKGKRDPGEHVLLTAVREVGEETGMRVTLGRPLGEVRYDATGHPKRVHWWAARPAGPADPFTPNAEVDRLEWLALGAAARRLSYERDLETLQRFTAGPADTVPCILLRHASAGDKRTWRGDDRARPLDPDGVAEAGLLRDLLACFRPGRVVSSAAERCMATVRPYAELVGAEIEVEPAFTIGPDRDVPAEQALRAGEAMGKLIDERQPAVVCLHGENLPTLMADACGHLGAEPPAEDPPPKGAFWTLHAADGRLAGYERHDPFGG